MKCKSWEVHRLIVMGRLVSEATIVLDSLSWKITLIAEANTIMQVSATRVLLTAKAHMEHSVHVAQKGGTIP